MILTEKYGTWRFDGRIGLPAQLERITGQSYMEQVYDPHSMYGANKWSVEIHELSRSLAFICFEGNIMTISLLPLGVNYPDNTYRTHDRDIEIAKFADVYERHNDPPKPLSIDADQSRKALIEACKQGLEMADGEAGISVQRTIDAGTVQWNVELGDYPDQFTSLCSEGIVYDNKTPEELADFILGCWSPEFDEFK